MLNLPVSASGLPPREIAFQAARKAGNILLARFSYEKKVTYKGRANIVTDVDLEVEKVVGEFLRQEYPSFGLLAEESPERLGTDQYRWIVDPLDGSRNYASGVPHFAIVIALAMGDDIILGITYDPTRNELFWAEKGTGAFLNDKRITVSNKNSLSHSLLGFDMGYIDEKAHHALELVQSLWPGVQTIRVMGSAALGLAYAASGRIDIYFHHNLAPWDLASGLILVREAGGVFTDKNGLPATLSSDSAIVTNDRLLKEFLETTDGMAWRA
jgi:myo-inositol-1(or 4)-monophosphatase